MFCRAANSMPRSSSKLWPPRRAPRSVRSPMSHLLLLGFPVRRGGRPSPLIMTATGSLHRPNERERRRFPRGSRLGVLHPVSYPVPGGVPPGRCRLDHPRGDNPPKSLAVAVPVSLGSWVSTTTDNGAGRDARVVATSARRCAGDEPSKRPSAGCSSSTSRTGSSPVGATRRPPWTSC